MGSLHLDVFTQPRPIADMRVITNSSSTHLLHSRTFLVPALMDVRELLFAKRRDSYARCIRFDLGVLHPLNDIG
jgi:hypothetical protein